MFNPRQATRLFVAWLIIASFAVAATFTLAGSLAESDSHEHTYNLIRLLTNDAVSEAADSFSLIADYDAFMAQVLPYLPGGTSRLEVVGNDGYVLFDTAYPTAASEGKHVDLSFYLHYDLSTSATNDGLVRFAFPLIVDGMQKANAIFYLPAELVIPDKQHNFMPVLLPLLSILATVTLVFYLLYRRFHKHYTLPLGALNKAVNSIARGNLDVKISWPAGTDLSTLSQSVDIMRLELKDLLARQTQNEVGRKELITKISHDLRTPLASIKAYVEGLKKGIAQDPQTVGKYLNVIESKTDSLTALLDDLLNYSLQEVGQLRIHLQEQYSKELLTHILEPLTVQFEDSPVTFAVKGELPDVLLNVDKTRLEQVIVNLVHNARKYTSPGGIISFSAVNEESHLRIAISDTGHGVSAADLPHIFDSFYRSPDVARDFEGAGLGLSICKYIVEQHEGRIWVESKLNQGSTFTFTIAKA